MAERQDDMEKTKSMTNAQFLAVLEAIKIILELSEAKDVIKYIDRMKEEIEKPNSSQQKTC